MKETYAKVAALLRRGEPFALATLARSRGSTPQKAGAQAVFYADGRTDGNLGGGCLEMEARRRALEALSRGRPEFFELRLNSDFGFDDGLICGGTADILVEPMTGRSAEPFETAAHAVSTGLDAGVALAVTAEDPASIGQRSVIVRPDPSGTASAADNLAAGDPRAELQRLAASAAAREIATPSLIDVPGGRVFVEPLHRSPALLVVGAGHVGTAVSRLASSVDFAVTVLDDRPLFADPERLPWAHRVLAADIPRTLQELELAPDSSVVIVTRGHRHDGVALRQMIGRPLAYLGMIGSRRKIKLIFDELAEEGAATPAELEAVRAPLGLDIGAQSVEEIAVSVVAELILVRHSGSGHDPSGLPLSRLRQGRW